MRLLDLALLKVIEFGTNRTNICDLPLEIVTSAVSRMASELWQFIRQKSPPRPSPVCIRSNALATGDPLRIC